MNKILLTGYRHSGTSMTMQLLRAHPQVGWIDDELGYIEYDQPKEWFMMMAHQRVSDMKHYSWGEKLPWATKDDARDYKKIIKDSKKWLKYFGKDARILQVLRHPLDVCLSTYPLDTNSSIIKKDHLKIILESIPKVIDFMNTDRRCAVVLYEELVFKPEVYLPKIFDFLNLSSNKKLVNKVLNTKLKFGKINSDRAFAYKKKKVKTKINYNKIIERINNKI